MPAIKETLYSDFDFTFTAHPVTGQLLKVKNRESVKQAVKLAILTNFYERPFKSQFGSDVQASLFELFDVFTEASVTRAIEVCINNYEPRAQLLDVQVSASEDQNSLEATIVFRPINQTEPVTLDLILERIR